jgi:hypothetical protein
MTFERDAFISYSHIDNVGLVEGQKGWVANLHHVLQTKVAQRLGRQSRIWRDPKLAGNDILTDALVEELRSCMALVSILTPGYIRSEWCQKELEEFCKAVDEQGSLVPADKARIFKVLKTPVPLHQLPPGLQSLIGYEFFKRDPESDRVRELDEVFGDEASRDFFVKVDDLVHDLCELVRHIEGGDTAASLGCVFLAETTSDLRDERDDIRRDLQQHGYTVLPSRGLSMLSATDAELAIREDLARCRLSVHMIGRNYSLVPEGGLESLVEMQNDLAIERGRGQQQFSRKVWIPRHLKVADERQRDVIDALRMDQRIEEGSDLLETSLEDLRTEIFKTLKGQDERKDGPTPAPPSGIQVYLQYDSRDVDAIAPWSDFLFTELGFEVVPPAFSGEEAELRQYHEDNLRTCDGVMVLYGAGSEPWLRRKLAELQKSAGYGRTKAMPEVVICLIPPRTPDKTRFRTHRALVVPQWEGLSKEPLQPFVAALQARGEERERDGAGDTT